MTTNPSEVTPRKKSRRFPWVMLVVMGVWLLVTIVLGMLYLRTPSSQLLLEARKAYDRQDFAKAKELALRIAGRNNADKEALLVAGRAAAAQENAEEALEYWSRIADDNSPVAVEARCLAGDTLLKEQGDIDGAVEQFRRALEQDFSNSTAHNRLAYLTALEHGGWAATAERIAIIRLRAFRWNHLHAVALTSDMVEAPEQLATYRERAPHHPGVLTALARVASNAHRAAEARQLLAQAVASHPEHLGAQVELGRASLKASNSDEFIRWQRALPSEVLEHPEIWALQGEFARERSEPLVAIRCFGEAVRRDPNHRVALYQLGQLLAAQNQAEAARPFLNRAQMLEEYEKTAEGTTEIATPEYHKAAELAERLQLYWEAFGWSYLALEGGLPAEWAAACIDRIRPQLAEIPSLRTPRAANPVLALELANYPLPDWNVGSSQPSVENAPPPLASRVTFEDRAVSAGVNFQYFNGGEPLKNGMKKMYEFTGGGVAVLDYDVDGWPDLYFTQGCAWPVAPRNREHSDRLFRNLGNGTFVDVTASVGIDENAFSQGVAAGDFDNDGLVDLYVANIGRNRLYHNNGDGTFEEWADSAAAVGDDWTTSCLIADLNGDAVPDIYAVNYLAGDDLFTRVCGSGDSVVLCLPQYFQAAPDQLFLGRGDGTFEDHSRAAGLDSANGRGLGIVAAQLYGDPQLDLFIANDMDANFLLAVEPQPEEGDFRFTDLALVQGLAADRNGRFQACMGVAAGDSDNDGRMDLVVTNFADEYNTLYRQRSEGFFEDDTQMAGLAVASFEKLGFGTQFLDADLDGDLDLLVTNGQIDDVRPFNRAFQMPPQFFENQGNGRFVEIAASSLGPFFESDYLGRGLARVDWNRDGLEDAVISHLDVPAALLTNTTQQPGSYLAVRLTGVESARDAIGATVTLTAGEQHWTRQLTAGDGYHASNQRLVSFGLGASDQPIALKITWPSGRVQEIHDLPRDREVWIVEGRDLTRVAHGDIQSP